MRHRSKILVIDDNATAREVIVSILAPEGYEVATAVDAAAGLLAAEAGEPDLILLDAMMPGLSGRDFLRLLRRITSMRSTPVLFMSALDEEDVRRKGIPATPETFLGKPFGRVELRERVARLIEPESSDPPITTA